MHAARKRVTIADVARAAGVSPATVSYVLNDAPNQKISARTRERVHAAVTTLGYTRSAAARALSTGRSDTVLLILPDWPIGPLIAELIESLTDELGKHGLSLITRRELPEWTVATLWRELVPAAVVFFGEVDVTESRAMRDAGVYVTGMSSSASDEDDFLLVSNEEIGRIQASHLAAAGHRRLGFAAPTDPRLQQMAGRRLDGVRRACLELGLDEPEVRPVALDSESASVAAAAWRSMDPPVTAVCAFNDEVAFALLHGMRSIGLSAPGDLALVGVDDIPTARFADPPLTTVGRDIPAISAHVSHMVSHGIAGKRPARPPVPDFATLVVRDSA
jgi:DNA-binding LacI/PurR family transcriptional regulator